MASSCKKNAANKPELIYDLSIKNIEKVKNARERNKKLQEQSLEMEFRTRCQSPMPI